MKIRLSRRDFIIKGTAALGAATACELTGLTAVGKTAWSQAAASEHPQENGMPHVSVKLWPGRSEEEKQQLANAIVEDVVNITGCSVDSVSVSIEDIPSGDWKAKVYEPEIRTKSQYLYKTPGYSM